MGELLERVGLTPAISHRFPHEFSGGQCQRIAIARVLATEPSCVVADEPISSLDASAQAQIANLLAGIVAESGPRDAVHLARPVGGAQDRGPYVVMYFGRIVESGPTERIWAEPAHPYTRGLIGAIPEPGAGSVLPSELKGDVPDPARPPPGCRFHPRCPVAMDRCRTEDPPPVEVEPGWQSLCLLSEPRRSRAGQGAQADRETATSAGRHEPPGQEVDDLDLRFWAWRAVQAPRTRDDLPRLDRPRWLAPGLERRGRGRLPAQHRSFRGGAPGPSVARVTGAGPVPAVPARSTSGPTRSTFG